MKTLKKFHFCRETSHNVTPLLGFLRSSPSDLDCSSIFSQRRRKVLHKAASTSPATVCRKNCLFGRGKGGKKNESQLQYYHTRL